MEGDIECALAHGNALILLYPITILATDRTLNSARPNIDFRDYKKLQ